jgi:hypothetical protein
MSNEPSEEPGDYFRSQRRFGNVPEEGGLTMILGAEDVS